MGTDTIFDFSHHLTPPLPTPPYTYHTLPLPLLYPSLNHPLPPIQPLYTSLIPPITYLYPSLTHPLHVPYVYTMELNLIEICLVPFLQSDSFKQVRNSKKPFLSDLNKIKQASNTLKS